MHSRTVFIWWFDHAVWVESCITSRTALYMLQNQSVLLGVTKRMLIVQGFMHEFMCVCVKCITNCKYSYVKECLMPVSLTGRGYHSLLIGLNSVNRKARNDPIPKRRGLLTACFY